MLAPKTLLRHSACVSALDEFGPGTGFRCVIGEDWRGARRVIITSGKIYHELAAERAARGLNRAAAIIRLEQLHPLDRAGLEQALATHPEAEVVWCQEEPANMGPFAVLDRPLEAILGRRLRQISRPAAAAPATGIHDRHDAERRCVFDAAFDGLSGGGFDVTLV